MRTPDVHGDKIVFSYAADLWILEGDSGVARRLTSHPGGESLPRFSPDGSMIAFNASYDGNPDVYVIPTAGGEPRRLTFMGTGEAVLDWTPDGKSIAFQSAFGNHTNRTSRMWMVPVEGGIPTPTVVRQVEDLSFSPDGKSVAYNRSGAQYFWWRRYRGGTQGRISIHNLETNTYREIPVRRENNYMPMWVGNSIFYISDRDFGTLNLFRTDLTNNRTTRITEYKDADIRVPATDGKTIIWERDGFLEHFDIASGKVTRVRASIPSDFPALRPRLLNVGGQINGMSLSPTGVRLAVDARGDVFSVPARNGDTRNLTNTQGVREWQPSWSPDGRLIAYLSDASGEVELHTRPQMGGEATRHRVDKLIQLYRWAPDGKSISYQTKDGRLILHDVATGNETLVARNVWQSGISYDFSPDSQWIAYNLINDNLQASLYLYNVQTKKSTKITEGYYSDESVTFDLNGKYLYFISGRTFQPTGGAYEFMMNMAPGSRIYAIPLDDEMTNPLIPAGDEEPMQETPAARPAAPAGAQPAAAAQAGAAPAATVPPASGEQAPAAPAVKPPMPIDIEGMAERALPLPWPAGSYAFIAGVNGGVLTYTEGTLFLWNWQARQSIPLYQGPLLGLTFNEKRTRMAINTGQGISIMAVAPGQDPNAGRVNTAGVEMVWDPRAEWRQIFWEAWRFQRDTFYDPKMLGLDWKAIGDRYAQYLPHVNHRNDLNHVFGLMIGELGTGHAYVGGGDMGDMGRPINVGHLGADFEVVGNNVRFAKIFRGLNFEEGRRGPLGDVGLNVKEGDFLLEIDGNRVSRSADPHQFLQGKAGRVVTLTVNSTPTLTGARKIRVRPVASETELRYISWVEANRKYVEQKSNGRIGYLHVPDTSMPGVIEFIKGFYAQVDKDAWIIDERYNGGGMIPTFFVEFLQREVVSKMRARDWKDIGFPTGRLDGPKAMLINEYAGSGGDMLPWLFREAKLGPLIGMRTWGGLVGIQGSAPLVDGGFFTSPGFGIYDPKAGKWIAENEGVEPDIEVDARPDLVAQGKDPQLDRAIEHLMGELRKPRRQMRQPDFPRPTPGR